MQSYRSNPDYVNLTETDHFIEEFSYNNNYDYDDYYYFLLNFAKYTY